MRADEADRVSQAYKKTVGVLKNRARRVRERGSDQYNSTVRPWGMDESQSSTKELPLYQTGHADGIHLERSAVSTI